MVVLAVLLWWMRLCRCDESNRVGVAVMCCVAVGKQARCEYACDIALAQQLFRYGAERLFVLLDRVHPDRRGHLWASVQAKPHRGLEVGIDLVQPVPRGELLLFLDHGVALWCSSVHTRAHLVHERGGFVVLDYHPCCLPAELDKVVCVHLGDLRAGGQRRKALGAGSAVEGVWREAVPGCSPSSPSRTARSASDREADPCTASCP